MSVLTGVGILLLSMLIVCFLQLSPGIFLLFSHYASGKYAQKQVSILSLFFVLGVETFIAVILTVLNILLTAIFFTFPSIDGEIFVWVMVGILVAIAIIFPFIYFRKGTGTELFIPRKLAAGINHKAKNAKSPSDAFVLGFFSSVPELIFSLPVFILSITMIMEIGENPFLRAGLIILFALAVILPLVIYRYLLKAGYNLAKIEKNRIKNKMFTRIMISFIYILLAILLLFGRF